MNDELLQQPGKLFRIKRRSRDKTCQAVRCHNKSEVDLPGDLWREDAVELCENCAVIALTFAEAYPEYEPPQTAFTPQERAELKHLIIIQEQIKLKGREGLDVLGIVRKHMITNQMELERSNTWLLQIVQERKTLEAQKEEIVGPMKLALSRVQALFRPVEQHWADAELMQRRKIELWKAGEADHNERAMAAAAEAIAAGDDGAATAALAKITNTAELEGTTLTEVWDVEIEDVYKVPQEYLHPPRPDISALKIYARTEANEGRVPLVPGVKFVKSARSTVRGVK